jgi:HEAT repeat protein
METRSLILSPSQYSQVPTYDLLLAAEQGWVGLDHRFLHAIVDDPEKSIPDLLRFGLEMEEREDRREDLGEDLIQIFRHLRTPRAIPYLIAYLRRNHLDATIPVICAFQEIGEPAVEPLLDLYREVGAEEDSDAAFLLGSLGVRDPRVLQVLVERLKIDPADAAHCLTSYGDPAAIPALREAIKDDPEEWVAQSLQSCVTQLEAPAPRTEDEPFDLWDLYPDETDPRFDLLTRDETERFLDSPDPENRFAAVSVIGEEVVPMRLWDQLLRMAREDPDARVRGECWDALTEGLDRPDIRKAMRACLADESVSDEERSGALSALAARYGVDAEIERVMLAFYERPATRAQALHAMAVSLNERFASYFRKHLDDPDSGVCIQAMLGTGLLQLESEAPRLVPYFQDEDLREEALPCYTMCSPCEPTRAGLRRLFKKIDDLAGGLSMNEEFVVKDALNTRAHGYELDAIYGPSGEALVDEPVVATVKVGRNDPCPCGSGKKYKKCCGG